VAGQLKDRPLIVITDLDGTLLDQRTYSYEQSLPAIKKLRERQIPLILCSSKTVAEITRLWRELRLAHPFICESGGAIYLPRNYFPFPIAAVKPRSLFDVIEFGADVLDLRAALRQAACRCAVQVKSFGTMTLDEIVFRTGLTMDQAIYARQREYDEPFFIEAGDEESLLTALQESGFAITKGDRFQHLTAGHGKGEAVKSLLNLYRRQYGSLVSVGLGNSANDLPMLRETEIAVLVRNPDSTWDVEITKHLPNAQRTDAIGPRGWREAIDAILDRFGA
jgi:mannosyl-3-phosphoglycerate phosphatase family protein